MSIMPSFCFVLNGRSVDGDTSSSFFGSFVYGTILDIFGFLFGRQILSDG